MYLSITHVRYGTRAWRSCTSQFLVVFECHFGTWPRNFRSMCVYVLCFQWNVAWCMVDFGFGWQWSVLLHIHLLNCELEAAMLSLVYLSLQVAVQKVIFSTQPRHSTKWVSWSCVHCLSTPFDVYDLHLSTVHVGLHGTVSCQTVLTRHHWMFCVDALYKLTFIIIRLITH